MEKVHPDHDVAPRRSGGRSDRASAAECGEKCDDFATQPRQLSGTGPAILSAAQTDCLLDVQFNKGAVMVQVARNESQPASLRQARIGVCIDEA